jgi:regulatory protein YycI of two-component signal transduction system YycFG
VEKFYRGSKYLTWSFKDDKVSLVNEQKGNGPTLQTEGQIMQRHIAQQPIVTETKNSMLGHNEKSSWENVGGRDKGQ